MMEYKFIEMKDNETEQINKYVVKYECPDVDMDADAIAFLKWYRRADLVLKKNGILFFVEQLPETKFEDIIEKN